jgi:penicillin-binding protein 1B
VAFDGASIKDLLSVSKPIKLAKYALEPELVANIVGGEREQRRPVRFDEIPKVLVQAITSAEDKRFFEHMGFDPFRLAKAAYVDMKSKRKEQGASTITMQLARGLYLDREKNWRRKAREVLISIILEQRLSKEKIFEFYVNQVYLGRRNTYSINGFGEAARVFFNKGIGQLTLPESATLAGLIQRPSYFNPFEHEDRAVARRNVVLELMRQNGYIDATQCASAANTPLMLTPPKSGEGEAPYFIALLNNETQAALKQADEDEDEGYQVYSTLDPDLQLAAVEAVRDGMVNVDKLVKRRNKDGAVPQAALIALDARTGEIRAAVGGRNYAESQLNHLLALRQPGSIFKPFVYAAAINSGLQGGSAAFTEATTVDDIPGVVFRYGKQEYAPGNFEDQYYGTVTLRQALAHSMNVATVTLGEKIGFQKVVDLAHRAGLNEKIMSTPSVALGSYDTTPLEMAGAYTVFANNGTYVRPTFIRQVRARDGRIVIDHSKPSTRQVLDPRVVFIMRDMLEEVVRSGTASRVRANGLKAPVAGKTGTSRDGWFAGFTSDLLCIVWVGFDDHRELNLEGAHSALPIWAQFMKKAVELRDVAHTFPPPPKGVVRVAIDPSSGLLVGPDCEPGEPAYFIAGTEPKTVCEPEEYDPWQTAIPGGDTMHSAAAAVGEGIGRVIKAPFRLFGHHSGDAEHAKPPEEQ